MEITVGDISRNQEIAFLRKADILSVKKLENKDEVLSLFRQYSQWIKNNDLKTVGIQGFLQQLLIVGSIGIEMLDLVYRTEVVRVNENL